MTSDDGGQTNIISRTNMESEELGAILIQTSTLILTVPYDSNNVQRKWFPRQCYIGMSII